MGTPWSQPLHAGAASVEVHPEGGRGDAAAAPEDHRSTVPGPRVQQPAADARRPGTDLSRPFLKPMRNAR